MNAAKAESAVSELAYPIAHARIRDCPERELTFSLSIGHGSASQRHAMDAEEMVDAARKATRLLNFDVLSSGRHSSLPTWVGAHEAMFRSTRQRLIWDLIRLLPAHVG